MEKENVWKNSEGYSDPTAGAVLAKEPKRWEENKLVYTAQGNSFVPGDVVECPIGNRFEDPWMLVLSSQPDTTICLELKEVVSDGYALRDQCWILPEFETSKERHRDYFVDTRRLRAYGTHTFGKKLGNVGDISLCLNKVGMQLGLASAPKEVAPEAGWILEEAPASDLLLQKQRADIYEKAFYALLERM